MNLNRTPALYLHGYGIHGNSYLITSVTIEKVPAKMVHLKGEKRLNHSKKDVFRKQDGGKFDGSSKS